MTGLYPSATMQQVRIPASRVQPSASHVIIAQANYLRRGAMLFLQKREYVIKENFCPYDITLKCGKGL